MQADPSKYKLEMGCYPDHPGEPSPGPFRFRWTLRPIGRDLRQLLKSRSLEQEHREHITNELRDRYRGLGQGLPGPKDKFVLEVDGFSTPFEFRAFDDYVIDLHAIEISWEVSERTASEVVFSGPLADVLAFEKDTCLKLKKKLVGPDLALAKTVLGSDQENQTLYLQALDLLMGQMRQQPDVNPQTVQVFLPGRFRALLDAELSKPAFRPLRQYFELADTFFLVLKEGTLTNENYDKALALAPANENYKKALEAIFNWSNGSVHAGNGTLTPPERLGKIVSKPQTPKAILDEVARASDEFFIVPHIRDFVLASIDKQLPARSNEESFATVNRLCESLYWDILQYGSHIQQLSNALAKTVRLYRQTVTSRDLVTPHFLQALLERDSRTGLSMLGAIYDEVEPKVKLRELVVMSCIAGSRLKATKLGTSDVLYERAGRYFGMESHTLPLPTGQKIKASLKWMRETTPGVFDELDRTRIDDCIDFFAADFRKEGAPLPEQIARAYVVETAHWELLYDSGTPKKGERWGYLEGVSPGELPPIPATLKDVLRFETRPIDAFGTLSGVFLVIKEDLTPQQIIIARDLLPASAQYQQQLRLLSNSQITKLIRMTSGEGQFSFRVENVGGQPSAGSGREEVAFSSCLVVPSLRPDRLPLAAKPTKAIGIVPKNSSDRFNETPIQRAALIRSSGTNNFHVPQIDFRQVFSQVPERLSAGDTDLPNTHLITEHIEIPPSSNPPGKSSGIEVVQVEDIINRSPDAGLKTLKADKVDLRRVPAGHTLYFWLWGQTASGEWKGPFPVKRDRSGPSGGVGNMGSPFDLGDPTGADQPDPVPVLWRSPAPNPPVDAQWDELAQSPVERERTNPKYRLTLKALESELRTYKTENEIVAFDVLVFRRTPNVDINVTLAIELTAPSAPDDLRYYFRQPWFAAMIGEGWKYVTGQFNAPVNLPANPGKSGTPWSFETSIETSSGWEVQTVVIGKRLPANCYHIRTGATVFLDTVSVLQCEKSPTCPTGVQEVPDTPHDEPFPFDIELHRSLPKITSASVKRQSAVLGASQPASPQGPAYLVARFPPKSPSADTGPGVKVMLRVLPMPSVPGVRTDQVLRLLATQPVHKEGYTIQEFRNDYIYGVLKRAQPDQATPLVDAAKKRIEDWLREQLSSPDEQKRVLAIEIRGIAGLDYLWPEVYDASLDLPIVGTRFTRVSRDRYADPKQVTVAKRTGDTIFWEKPIPGLIRGAKGFIEYKDNISRTFIRGIFDIPQSMLQTLPTLPIASVTPIGSASFPIPSDRTLLFHVGVVARFRKDPVAPVGVNRIIFPAEVPTGPESVWHDGLVARVELRDASLAGDPAHTGLGKRSAFGFVKREDIVATGLKSLSLQLLPGTAQVPDEGYAVLAPATNEWLLKNLAHEAQPSEVSNRIAWDVLASGQDDDICWVMRHLGPGVPQQGGNENRILPNCSDPIFDIRPIHSSITPATPILGGAHCQHWNINFLLKTLDSKREPIYDDSVRLVGKLIGKKQAIITSSALAETKTLQQILLGMLENNWPKDQSEINKVRAWIRCEASLAELLASDINPDHREIPLTDGVRDGLSPNSDFAFDQNTDFSGITLTKLLKNHLGQNYPKELSHESWVWSIRLKAVENADNPQFRLESEFTQGETFYRPLPPLFQQQAPPIVTPRNDEILENKILIKLELQRPKSEIIENKISYFVAVRRTHKVTSWGNPLASKCEYVTLMERETVPGDFVEMPGGRSAVSFPLVRDRIGPIDLFFEPAIYQVAIREKIAGITVSSGDEGVNFSLPPDTQKPVDIIWSFLEKGENQLLKALAQPQSLIDRLVEAGWQRDKGNTFSYFVGTKEKLTLPFDYRFLGEDEGIYILSLTGHLEYNMALLEGISINSGELEPASGVNKVVLGLLV
jgi:hypothetical protein